MDDISIKDFVLSTLVAGDVENLGDTCQVSMRLPIDVCASLDSLSIVLKKNKTSVARKLLTLALIEAVHALPEGLDFENYQAAYDYNLGQYELSSQ